MSQQLDADVIVAGAGPAGTAAAIHLRRAGRRVLLLDWQSFPRDKVCGDFLSAVSLAEIEALDLTRAVRQHANVIRRVAVSLDGRPLLTSPLPRSVEFPEFGRVIPRELFDHLLVSKAIACGARLVSGYRVNGYRETQRHLEVQVQAGQQRLVLRAHALIGADGSTSVIARQMRGQPIAEEDRMIAVRAYFERVTGPADRADLCFSSAAFPGYAWLFPTGPHAANVGVGIVLKTLPRSPAQLPTLFRKLISADPALRDRLAGATITQKIAGWPLTTYNPALPIMARHVALVGDAAGLINPLNGEGIQYALTSGRWAAEAVGRGKHTRDATFTSYANHVDAEWRDDLRISRLLVDLIRNRSLSAFWLDGLETITARAAADREYAALAGGVLAGVVPTRRVVQLDIVRKTLQEALRRAVRQTLSEAARRPASLAAMVLKLTDASLAAARPMLAHRTDTEQWLIGIARTAIQVTAATIKQQGAATSTYRGGVGRGSLAGEDVPWPREPVRARQSGRTVKAAIRRRDPAAGGVAATSSGSPSSTLRRRKL
jgi:geranylgeranyl reductase family protein